MCALVTGVQTCALPISIGLAVQSFVEVQIRFDAHIEFEAAVLAHPAVVECHTTAGESDYLLKIFARSADHLDELLRHNLSKLQIGREQWRERGSRYVYISGAAVSLKKKKKKTTK